MSIIDRYLLREIVAAFVGVTAVLLLITMGSALSQVLDLIARGRIPAPLFASQLALRTIDGLPAMLPLALFLGVLLAYGRLYRDSEMVVLAASGVTGRALLRPMLMLAVPLTAVLSVVTFWAGPAAMRLSDRMLADANRSLLVVGLEAGRFVELPGRDGVIWVGSMSDDGGRFGRLFLVEEDDGRVDVTTAASGELFNDREGNERYLRLAEGFRVEGVPGENEWRTMRFTHNDIRLPDPERGDTRRAEKRYTLAEVLNPDTPLEHAEFHFRLGLPLSALLLGLLAVPLAHSRPREPRHAKLLVAFFAYMAYANLMALGRGWIGDGRLPVQAGLWWVHAIALAGFVWLAFGDRLRLRRRG